FMFSLTRLNGIPRSVLIVHALFLLTGLVAARAVVRLTFTEERNARPLKASLSEQVLILGANKLSALYISFLKAYSPGRYEVLGILDDARGMVGRSIAGARVLGTTDHLAALIEEFKEHGVMITGLFVGTDPEALSEPTRAEIDRVCREYNIQIDFIPQLVGLSRLEPQRREVRQPAASSPPQKSLRSRPATAKRTIDFC